MATLPLRQIEGKYEILAKLKEGGMGTIYKVRHRLLDEVRVVKVMRPQISDSEDLQRRFAREARAAIRLKHPNIAQLYDFAVEPDGVAYMVMEFIDGVTLQEMLARNGPAPVELTLEIARQGLEALRYLHAGGYVHRDIAPDNLMLTKDFAGQPLVKVIDLGIVKHLGGGGEGLTATGMFLGKVRYSSPEQFSGEKGTVDRRSDLYSFGVMLYELLTGTCPVAGDNLSQLVAAHLFHPPKSFDQTDPEGRVPPEIRAAVLRSLAKKAEDRISTADEFLELLAPPPKTQNLAVDLEKTLATTLSLRDVADLAPPGTTQGRLDERFGLVSTPRPGPGLRAIDATAGESPKDRLTNLLSTARRLADERQWDDARLVLYQALAIDPDQEEIRALLGEVESALRQAAEDEKRRQVVVRALEPVELCLTEERADDASRELERVRSEHGDHAELAAIEGRIAELRETLAARARDQEIAERASSLAALLDAEKVDEAAQALHAAVERFGEVAPFGAMQIRLAQLKNRVERRRLEEEAAARRRQERMRALLDEAAAHAARKDFAAAIARAEEAVTLDPAASEAPQAIERYRAEEEEHRALLAREHAVVEARSEVETLLLGGQPDAAERALEDAVARVGSEPRLESLRGEIASLRRELEERARAEERSRAIGAAAQRIEGHLREERVQEAQSELAEAGARLGPDPKLDGLAAEIARVREEIAARERRRVEEERRRAEEKRLREEAEKRKREEAERRRVEEERRRAEEKRLREETEKREREEAERRRIEEKQRRAEEQRRRAEAERQRREEEERRRIEEERRREQEERERRERAVALLAEAARLSAAESFTDAVARAEEAVALDAQNAAAKQALDEYRAAEARQRAELLERQALEEATARIRALLDQENVTAAERELDAARARFGDGDELWAPAREELQALRRRLAEREREAARQTAIGVAVSAIESHLARERVDEAQLAVDEARAQLGADPRLDALPARIEQLREELAERERRRIEEQRRREEEERRQRAEQRRREEEQRRRLAAMLESARAELAQGRPELASSSLEPGRAEFADDPDWQRLLGEVQAELARREAERRHRQAVEAEAHAISTLLDKRKVAKAAKRLEQARGRLGADEALLVGLARQVEAAQAEARRPDRSSEPGAAPLAKPWVWAVAAVVLLALGLGSWAIFSGRSAPTAELERAAAEDAATAARVGDETGRPFSAEPRVPGDSEPLPPDTTSEAAAAPGAAPRRETAATAPDRSAAVANEADRASAQRAVEPPAVAAVPASPRDERPEDARPQDGARQRESSRAPAEVTAERSSERAAAAPAPSESPARSAPPSSQRPAQPPAPERIVPSPVERAAQPPAVVPPPPARPVEPPISDAVPPAAQQAEQSPPPAARPADERQDVLAALDRYRRAYESLDADAVTRVFTGADERELRRAFRQTKSMSVDIDLAGCQVTVTGDRATASCDVNRVTNPKAGETLTRRHRDAFQLRKASSGWVVERVQ